MKKECIAIIGVLILTSLAAVGRNPPAIEIAPENMQRHRMGVEVSTVSAPDDSRDLLRFKVSAPATFDAHRGRIILVGLSGTNVAFMIPVATVREDDRILGQFDMAREQLAHTQCLVQYVEGAMIATAFHLRLLEFAEKKEKRQIGIGTPLAERPSHTTNRTDRVISGSAAY
jgi:hypothetical protein